MYLVTQQRGTKVADGMKIAKQVTLTCDIRDYPSGNTITGVLIGKEAREAEAEQEM